MNGRSLNLADFEREVISRLYTSCLTFTQIAKNLSRGRSTVSNVVLKFKSTGSYQKKKRPGSKEKLSSRDQRKLAIFIKSNRRGSRKHILAACNKQSDCKTSQRILDCYKKKLELSRCIAGKNQVLGKKLRQTRIKWALQRRGLIVDNYLKQVIFTDECTIKIS